MANLKLDGISKSFPGVRALSDVSLSIEDGEIHALCGENGAGKSTLMNILAGNLQPDEGTITLHGRPAVFHSPQEAFDAGISIVYQHLSLVDCLNVAENIYPNQQPVSSFGFIDSEELYRRTNAILQQLGLSEIKPHTKVLGLSPAQKQMVEIAKALAKKPSLLILDEPTASLTEKETQALFGILQQLKREGVSIIYISHRLEEIFLLADRISILKDGRYQGTFPKLELSKDDLIRKMVGRDIQTAKFNSGTREEVLLSVRNLSGKRFRNISFELHRGEILGFAGLVGAGRTEIARAIFGIDQYESGKVFIGSDELVNRHPANAVSRGLAYLPEDRKSLGIFPEMSILDNIVISKQVKSVTEVFTDRRKDTQSVEDLKNKLRIVTPGIQQKVTNLSGGNQQKVVLAKWLLTSPDVLIVDEPTHGIDIGAKFEIYELLKSLASQGKGILMISSELPELLGICDRIIVINKGRIAGELEHAEATEENIMTLASN